MKLKNVKIKLGQADLASLWRLWRMRMALVSITLLDQITSRRVHSDPKACISHSRRFCGYRLVHRLMNMVAWGTNRFTILEWSLVSRK